MSLAWRLARQALFALAPEVAHGLALRALAVLPLGSRAPADPRLRQRLLGLDFANPIGMAAGFDKNGEVADGLLSLGFGFAEIGTVTPLAQAGNPPPRLFRLTRDGALINRLGFNNQGHAAVHRRLAARRPGGGIVGVNVGTNRDSPDRIADYAAGVARFADVADYIAINVSSPNTPGLRDLQERAGLTALLLRAVGARDEAAKRVPLLLKIAPDLDDAALAAVAETAIEAKIDGLIVSNTTLARDGLSDTRLAAEAGGLSGRPLYQRSTLILAKLRRLVGRDLVLVGAGGVDSVETALGKIRAGADLVQLYTGLVFNGPGLPAAIVAGLAARLARDGVGSIADLVGVDAAAVAASPSGLSG